MCIILFTHVLQGLHVNFALFDVPETFGNAPTLLSISPSFKCLNNTNVEFINFNLLPHVDSMSLVINRFQVRGPVICAVVIMYKDCNALYTVDF